MKPENLAFFVNQNFRIRKSGKTRNFGIRKSENDCFYLGIRKSENPKNVQKPESENPKNVQKPESENPRIRKNSEFRNPKIRESEKTRKPESENPRIRESEKTRKLESEKKRRSVNTEKGRVCTQLKYKFKQINLDFKIDRFGTNLFVCAKKNR